MNLALHFSRIWAWQSITALFSFRKELAHAVLVMLTIVSPSSAVEGQQRTFAKPEIRSHDAYGQSFPVAGMYLSDVELMLQDSFARVDAPNEVIALVCGESPAIRLPFVGRPVSAIIVSMWEKHGEIRWYQSDAADRFYYLAVDQTEMRAIRTFFDEGGFDDLPELSATRPMPDGTIATILGAGEYAYLRLTPTRGNRVVIAAPPVGGEDHYKDNDPIWKYRQLVDYFEQFCDSNELGVRYEFRRPIAGFEVVYADPNAEVLAVWNQDNEVCVTVRDKWDFNAKEQHWICRGGKLEREIEPTVVRRKTEPQESVNGVKLQPTCCSSNGRWLVGNRTDNGEFVCFDRETKEWSGVTDNLVRTKCYPLHYLEAHNAFLLGRIQVDRISLTRLDDNWRNAAGRSLYLGFSWDPTADLRNDWHDLHSFWLFDPSGESPVVEANVAIPDSRLWLQDLSGTPTQGVIWAAVPSGNATKIGRFDVMNFKWLAYDFIPNLRFETRHMLLDENGDILNVIYRGHLLRMPLPLGLRAVECH